MNWLPISYDLKGSFLISWQEMWMCKAVSRYPMYSKWQKSLTPSLGQVEVLYEPCHCSKEREEAGKNTGWINLWRSENWRGQGERLKEASQNVYQLYDNQINSGLKLPERKKPFNNFQISVLHRKELLEGIWKSWQLWDYILQLTHLILLK